MRLLRLLGISCQYHVTNEILKEKTKHAIESRRLPSHDQKISLAHSNLAKTILNGFVQGGRPSGRQKEKMGGQHHGMDWQETEEGFEDDIER